MNGASSPGSGSPAVNPVLAAPAQTAPVTQQRAPKRARTKSPDEGTAAAVTAEPKAKARAKSETKKAPQAAASAGETAEATPAEGETVTSGKDWLIVAKSVRAMLKGMPNGMHCGADALPMLNTRVQEILTEAASRASGNSRKTLKACDF
jgi:hypothetical protein